MYVEMRCKLCGKLLFKHKGNNFTIEAKCTRCGGLNTFSYYEYNAQIKVDKPNETRFTN
jgi:phage FluMu protein Com